MRLHFRGSLGIQPIYRVLVYHNVLRSHALLVESYKVWQFKLSQIPFASMSFAVLTKDTGVRQNILWWPL